MRKFGQSQSSYAVGLPGTPGGAAHELRNLLNLPLRKYHFEMTRDLVKCAYQVCARIFGYDSLPDILRFLHEGFTAQCKLFHLWNQISIGGKPWVCTFETFLPRWGMTSTVGLRRGLRYLATHDCRRLIAISQSSYDAQSRFLDPYPSFKDEIMSKVCIIHPPQVPLIKSYDEKELDAEFIIFTLIGHEFFRKGGKETIFAFDRLLSEGYPIRLNIVSNMSPRFYGIAVAKASQADVDEVMRIIGRHPHHITYHGVLSNQEVLAMLRHSDVGLLPTYMETYGYAILEAQAAGCPVISTNVRAVPEINNNDIGWIIELPKDERGNARISEEHDRRHASQLLEAGLIRILRDIVADRQQIRPKGKQALARIKRMHDPLRAASALEAIYDEIMNGCKGRRSG